MVVTLPRSQPALAKKLGHSVHNVPVSRKYQGNRAGRSHARTRQHPQFATLAGGNASPETQTEKPHPFASPNAAVRARAPIVVVLHLGVTLRRGASPRGLTSAKRRGVPLSMSLSYSLKRTIHGCCCSAGVGGRGVAASHCLYVLSLPLEEIFVWFLLLRCPASGRCTELWGFAPLSVPALASWRRFPSPSLYLISWRGSSPVAAVGPSWAVALPVALSREWALCCALVLRTVHCTPPDGVAASTCSPPIVSLTEDHPWLLLLGDCTTRCLTIDDISWTF